MHTCKCRYSQRVLHSPCVAFEKTDIEMWLGVLHVCEINNVRVVGKDLEMPWRRLAATYSIMRSPVHPSMVCEPQSIGRRQGSV